jgi:hypothetical protein
MNNGIIILHNLRRSCDSCPTLIVKYYKLNKCKDSTI